MTKEGENGRDDMLIDDPQQVEDEGFNSNYLKVYYGDNEIISYVNIWYFRRNPACDQSHFRRKALCPFKIHIGPVYNVDPSKRHANAASGDNIFAPVERELVFDIDISDYDDARYCCSRADVCDCCH
ncbi:DNA primase isoform 3 [Artemisia annua]|uniref:DNA primase isoform 3 n=1 Tax=Artemisia annua TaxID=35608 RepID=A0A2U1LCC3_ARTAN|nr:DNA primase isoform 3 [Artemisia annua]